MVYNENDTELSWLFRPSAVYDENEQDNDVIDCRGVVYTKNDNKLSWPIEPGALCYKKKIEQQHDWLYRCNLYQKWNWAILVD